MLVLLLQLLWLLLLRVVPAFIPFCACAFVAVAVAAAVSACFYSMLGCVALNDIVSGAVAADALLLRGCCY